VEGNAFQSYLGTVNIGVESSTTYPVNEITADVWESGEYEESTSAVFVGILEMLAVLVVAAIVLLVLMWSVRSVVDRFGVRAGRDEKVMVSVNSRVSAASLSEV